MVWGIAVIVNDPVSGHPLAVAELGQKFLAAANDIHKRGALAVHCKNEFTPPHDQSHPFSDPTYRVLQCHINVNAVTRPTSIWRRSRVRPSSGTWRASAPIPQESACRTGSGVFPCPSCAWRARHEKAPTLPESPRN